MFYYLVHRNKLEIIIFIRQLDNSLTITFGVFSRLDNSLGIPFGIFRQLDNILGITVVRQVDDTFDHTIGVIRWLESVLKGNSDFSSDGEAG